MARLVLTDASPLIGLALVSGLPWLGSLFGQVWVPPAVLGEVLPATEPTALPGRSPVWRGAADIRQALSDGWLAEWPEPIPDLPLPDLDDGETQCIRIALQQRQTTGEPALLLMDERAGRAVATEQGLEVASTAALIGLARQRGLIDSARAVFERLHGSDFRTSAEVIRTVLDRVGEADAP